jgi:hypothetical protein
MPLQMLEVFESPTLGGRQMVRILTRAVALTAFLILSAGGSATARASHVPFAEADARLPRAQVSTAREAARWLGLQGLVRAKQLERVSGVHPLGNGPSLRWNFPDGVLLTQCTLRSDGQYVIVCWGRKNE